VIDQPGTVLLSKRVENDETALPELIDTTAEIAAGGEVCWATDLNAGGAAIIAEAARSMPHTLRSIALDDETLAEIGVLCGFDDDLTAQDNCDVQPDPWAAHSDPPGSGACPGPASRSPRGGGPDYPVSDTCRAEDRRPRTCQGTVEEARTPARGTPDGRGLRCS